MSERLAVITGATSGIGAVVGVVRAAAVDTNLVKGVLRIIGGRAGGRIRPEWHRDAGDPAGVATAEPVS